MTEWKNLRFSVSSRKVEDGERFYRHAGFFPTLAESERWPDTFRSKYPNAFVSQLGSKASAGAPGSAVLSETQMLWILEVRARRRDDSLDEHAESGLYTATPEARPQRPPEPSSIAITASAFSGTAPATTTAAAAAGRPRRELAKSCRRCELSRRNPTSANTLIFRAQRSGAADSASAAVPDTQSSEAR
jgi:hypothetical protein